MLAYVSVYTRQALRLVQSGSEVSPQETFIINYGVCATFGCVPAQNFFVWIGVKSPCYRPREGVDTWTIRRYK